MGDWGKSTCSDVNGAVRRSSQRWHDPVRDTINREDGTLAFTAVTWEFLDTIR
jgi:hypothetical protein